MKTRCKFKVYKVTRTTYAEEIKVTRTTYAEEITLDAVYGGAGQSEENQSFATATPKGTLTITVDNPAVKGSFEPGQYYYLDLTPALE